METCHTNFVLSSPVRNLQKKSYVDLNEYTWGLALRFFVTISLNAVTNFVTLYTHESYIDGTVFFFLYYFNWPKNIANLNLQIM